MLAYKGFGLGLICRGYQFVMGLNVTDEANCAQNGFHCAANPLDCLRYYSNMSTSEYYLVDAGGDLNEDDGDSRISCTHLTIIKKLDLEAFLVHSLVYVVNHPRLPWGPRVLENKASVGNNGFAIARGVDPLAKGPKGSVLGMIKEESGGKKIAQIALVTVDGKEILPNAWYDIDLNKRRGGLK